MADLETLLGQRGAALLACDAARQLAVDTLTGQQSDLGQWHDVARNQKVRP